MFYILLSNLPKTSHKHPSPKTSHAIANITEYSLQSNAEALFLKTQLEYVMSMEKSSWYLTRSFPYVD